jgi:mevalonate kinase
MPALSASAPGKTILFGEHAVVYGYPAIAFPLPNILLKVIIQALPDQKQSRIINQQLQEDYLLGDKPDDAYQAALITIQNNLQLNHLPAMQLTFSSTIPLAAGLGSSAAFSVAITKAVSTFLGFRLSLEQINHIAFEIEKRQHGTPSGIDNTVVCYQTPIYFLKNHPFEFIQLPKPMILILANSGIPSSTIEAVRQVRQMRETHPDKINQLLERIGSITEKARDLIVQGDHESVGALMSINHDFLRELDLSTKELDNLVDTALQSGAYGAKLCGSGKGGNVVALVSEDKAQQIYEKMKMAGAADCLSVVIRPSESKL